MFSRKRCAEYGSAKFFTENESSITRATFQNLIAKTFEILLKHIETLITAVFPIFIFFDSFEKGLLILNPREIVGNA